MRWLLGVFYIVASSAAFATSPAALFDAHGCRSCHKIGERGGSSGPDLTMVGHRRPRAWIETWLASPRAYKHNTDMPEQGLSASDRVALSDYLAQQKGQGWTRRPWLAQGAAPYDGRRIYLLAGCVACHGPAGQGGHPNPGGRGGWIPPLPRLLATYTKAELVSKLARGAIADSEPGRTAVVDMPGWEGVLNALELDALADYLLTLAKTDPKDDF